MDSGDIDLSRGPGGREGSIVYFERVQLKELIFTDLTRNPDRRHRQITQPQLSTAATASSLRETAFAFRYTVTGTT